MSPTRRKNISLLLVAVMVETACCTYLLKDVRHTDLYSLIYLVAGLSMPFLFITAQYSNPPQLLQTQKKWRFYLRAGCMAIVAIYFIQAALYWQNLMPIDPGYADMLPIMQFMNQRFVAGHWHDVYNIIPEIWGGVMPIYLPAMWLPFAPAIAWQFDMRWITAGFLFLAFAIFINKIDWNLKRNASMVMLVPAVAICWWLLAEDDFHGIFTRSEEGIVIFYYSFLTIALLKENIYLITAATLLCMLSRYSLIGWIPAFLLYLILQKRKKDIVIFISGGLLGFLLLCILPFGTVPFIRLLQLPHDYIPFAKRVWQDSPEVYWLGLGVAKFFAPDNIPTLHWILIISCFTMPSIFIAGAFIVRKKITNKYVPVAALKLSLVIFYNFIDVPYMYLFYTSSFVSIIVIAEILRRIPTTVYSAF